MLPSIAPAINLENSGEKNYSSCFFVLCTMYLARFTSGYLLYSCFTAYAANVNSEKENTIRGVFADRFAFIRVSSRGIAGFTDQRSAFTRAQSTSRFEFARRSRVKYSLFTKLISPKRTR